MFVPPKKTIWNTPCTAHNNKIADLIHLAQSLLLLRPSLTVRYVSFSRRYIGNEGEINICDLRYNTVLTGN